jgi:hypothetical protein
VEHRLEHLGLHALDVDAAVGAAGFLFLRVVGGEQLRLQDRGPRCDQPPVRVERRLTPADVDGDVRASFVLPQEAGELLVQVGRRHRDGRRRSSSSIVVVSTACGVLEFICAWHSNQL